MHAWLYKARLPYQHQSCKAWMVFDWLDMHFANIKTSLQMHAKLLTVLEK